MGLGSKTYFDAAELYFVQTYDILGRLICADLDDDDICADLDGDDILSKLILVQF